MRVGAWVRSYFAEVSKIVQDAPRAGTQTPEHHNRNTSDHYRNESTTEHKRPEPEHQQAHEHARIKRNYKNNSKLIFFKLFAPYLCNINQKQQSNMATLTFRIYKNELDENRLDYIRKRYSTHIVETEKVLTVEGEKDDILKLYDNYLLSEAKFKAAFPDYMTQAERIEYTHKKIEGVKSYVQNALLEILANGEINGEFAKLRRLYLDYLK